LIPYQLYDSLSFERDAFLQRNNLILHKDDQIHANVIFANLAVPPLLGADCVVAAEAEQLTLPSTLNLCAPTAPVPDSGHDPTVQLRV
jgi:hypothetical protein